MSSFDIEKGTLVGVGLAAYGTTIVLFRKYPKVVAAASALFGLVLFANGVLAWRRIPALEAGPKPEPRRGRVLGEESLHESYDRVRSAKLTKQLVRAPSLEDRVAILRKLAREGSESAEVREKALAVLSRVCGSGRDRRWCTPTKDWDGEVKAIGEAFRDPRAPIGVRYVRDPIGKDAYAAVEKTLRTKSADCDDCVSALAALYGSVGYSVRFVPMSAKGAGGSPTHIYVKVGVPPGPPERVQKWIPVDVTVDKPIGWEPPDSVVDKRWEFDV